jgi:anti-sigma B factor antagonist
LTEEEMKFELKERDDVMILILDGDIVGGPEATLLSEKFHDLADSGKKKIVMDLEKVAYMNSSGLGILIGGVTTVRNHGGDLKLLHPGKKARDLLRITQLDRVFEVFEDEDKAVDSFS